ncbi:MAG: hypothetical protein J6X55_04585 [Victivallales bacterium]|nr:hypothetical protein [Victivallales bacterium]
MRNHWILCLVMLASSIVFCKEVSWHHSNSPYRAVYEIKSKSNNPQCGVVIEVPHCGVGEPDGRDVYCFDETGQQLKRAQLGSSGPGTCLVLARPAETSKEIYAYFGTKSSASKMPSFEKPLTCELRTFEESQNAIRSVAQAERQLSISKFIGKKVVDKIGEVANTFDSRKNFIMVFEGRYYVPKAGVRTLFIASSGPAYLYIDGKLEIDATKNSNVYANLRGASHKDIELKAGVHDLKMVAFSRETEPPVVFGAALGRAVMKGKEVASVLFVQGADFMQGGHATLKHVEAHNKAMGVPAFSYVHKSYMELEECSLTETELSTFSGQEANWEFADGVTMKGAKVTRLFSELSAVPVKVTVKRAKAEGTVVFPMNAPPTRKIAANAKDFDYYAHILESQKVEKMNDAKALLALLTFLQWRDCHPLCVPVAQAFLRTKKGRPEERRNALLCLARAGANGEAGTQTHAVAQDAYVKLLKEGRATERETILPEAVEFALFGMRNQSLAENWLTTYGAKLPQKLYGSLLMDVYIQSGRYNEAQGEFQKLLEGKRFGSNQKSSAVRGSSFHEAAERAIGQQRLMDARDALQRWSLESPIDRSNGSFSLVRARYFEKRGWLSGAEGELKGAMSADKELPFLPDVEYELAVVYGKMGRGAEAKALFKKVAETYPNHPLAHEAAKRK